MAADRGADWLTRTPAGYQLRIRLTPKAARDDIDGQETAGDGQTRLKVRVRAVPEKGKANKALIALLAKRCGVARTRIRLLSGETSRLKTLEIAEPDEALQARLIGLGALPGQTAQCR